MGYAGARYKPSAKNKHTNNGATRRERACSSVTALWKLRGQKNSPGLSDPQPIQTPVRVFSRNGQTLICSYNPPHFRTSKFSVSSCIIQCPGLGIICSTEVHMANGFPDQTPKAKAENCCTSQSERLSSSESSLAAAPVSPGPRRPGLGRL